MTLSIHPMTISDIPRTIAIESAGFASTPIRSSLWPCGISSTAITQLIAQDTHDLQTKQNITWLCIRRRLTQQQVIAVAKWRLEDSQSYETKKKAPFSTSPPEGMCKEVREAYSRALAGKLRDVMGSGEFWHLGTLVTDPQHERKGAGRMLVEWGCRRADAEGRKCSLHATPGAKKLYLACGFEVVSETEIDIRH